MVVAVVVTVGRKMTPAPAAVMLLLILEVVVYSLELFAVIVV